MKRAIFIGVLLACIIISGCGKTNEEFTICANRCPASAPWKVESLDLGLPCFASKEECQAWASTHGYSGKPCVTCD